MIEAEDLTVSFGRVAALRGVSFHVERGGSFGLVGESGSGKTTVLRVVAGLIPDWGGRLSLAGETVLARSPRRFHRRLQMVFQDPYGSLHPRHTVDRILAEPLAIHRLPDPERRIARALDDVGLGPAFRFRYPHQLSGGQRQRVAIARALVLEPEILLLDEPTSALDVSVQAEILKLLVRLKVERGLTTVLVSHNLAVVAMLCDRIAVMREGVVVEETSVSALREERVSHPYTRQLLAASRGYDPALARRDL
ncbi:MAG: ABC transporter ATP-binding protein [Rhodospirillales bacterium]|nr:ABC transporter ATP-binding protein [Rhodospirillales bacterium]